MSLLSNIVLSVFFFKGLFLLFFRLLLTIELNLHESSPLCFPSLCLLLLFKMKKCIELLYSSPLIFFFNIRIWFFLWGFWLGNHWLSIIHFLSLGKILRLWSTCSRNFTTYAFLTLHVIISFLGYCGLRALRYSAFGILITPSFCQNCILFLSSILFKLDFFIKCF